MRYGCSLTFASAPNFVIRFLQKLLSCSCGSSREQSAVSGTPKIIMLDSRTDRRYNSFAMCVMMSFDTVFISFISSLSLSFSVCWAFCEDSRIVGHEMRASMFLFIFSFSSHWVPYSFFHIFYEVFDFYQSRISARDWIRSSSFLNKGVQDVLVDKEMKVLREKSVKYPRKNDTTTSKESLTLSVEHRMFGAQISNSAQSRSHACWVSLWLVQIRRTGPRKGSADVTVLAA